jgi:hypothetical protein
MRHYHDGLTLLSGDLRNRAAKLFADARDHRKPDETGRTSSSSKPRPLDALPYANLKGLYVFADDPSMIENRAQIAAGALRARLPTISAPRAFAAAGGLMSYGMDIADDFRLSASYVVKVAQGTKAADLPASFRRATNSPSTCAPRRSSGSGCHARSCCSPMTRSSSATPEASSSSRFRGRC